MYFENDLSAAALEDGPPVAGASSSHHTPSQLAKSFWELLPNLSCCLKGLCHKSNMNRGALRDEGLLYFVVGALERGRRELEELDAFEVRGGTPKIFAGRDSYRALVERGTASAALMLKYMCCGNNGNKKVGSEISVPIPPLTVFACSLKSPPTSTFSECERYRGGIGTVLGLQNHTTLPAQHRLASMGLPAVRCRSNAPRIRVWVLSG